MIQSAAFGKYNKLIKKKDPIKKVQRAGKKKFTQRVNSLWKQSPILQPQKSIYPSLYFWRSSEWYKYENINFSRE